MKPYLFRLADGGLGVRDTTGTRPLNGGEIEGPFAGERVWDVPKDSNWEGWIRRELAKYERELDPPAGGPGGQVAFPNYVGTGRIDIELRATG